MGCCGYIIIFLNIPFHFLQYARNNFFAIFVLEGMGFKVNLNSLIQKKAYCCSLHYLFINLFKLDINIGIFTFVRELMSLGDLPIISTIKCI